MNMARRRLLRFVLVVATLGGAAALSGCSERVTVIGEVPERLDDTTYWRLFETMSEDDGYFRSDNFVSNEAAFQYVIPRLQRTVKPGAAYLGVGPDQNFTYLVAFRPKIAFIVDIRRQNAMLHLMYKSLIEMSRDRAEFMSMLFSRPRPAGLDTSTAVGTLLGTYSMVAPSNAFRDSVMMKVRDHLRVTHGFDIRDEDLASIRFVHDAFFESGPDLTYSFGQGNTWRYSSPGTLARSMPSYARLMAEDDGAGVQRSYLATEENFRALKDLETRNLVVPVVGNFSGTKALRSVARWLRQHDATVGVFYTSNVEQYLYQQGDDWQRFYDNVATFPTNASSTFIRSAANRMSPRSMSSGFRMVQLTMPIEELLAEYRAKNIPSYGEMISRNQ
jgi:hypothetical protein